jgi:multiple sugar transport system ATP-binding protein
MTFLKLKNISKKYDTGDMVVENLSLNLDEKEFLVLLGPSGCGKSTLLRIISGLEEASGGDLFLKGERINDLAPKDRHVGMVFQNYALYPHLNVHDNLAFPLKVKKVKKINKKNIEEKVNEIAEIIGLEDFLFRKPKQLSGGQKQRVALGRALITNPDVFLFDEPLSNLDAALRNSMRGEILKVHRNSEAGSIYVTHDQTEAMTMADRIILLDGGNIMANGTPSEIYNNPKNLFTAEFIGSPKINVYNINKNNHKDDYIKFLTNNVGDEIADEFVIAVRPENFRILDSEENYDNNSIKCEISKIENLGHEYLIHFVSGGYDGILRTKDFEKKNENNEIRISLSGENYLIFDQTGARIE